jgi:CBS-domain-containing membrane protein
LKRQKATEVFDKNIMELIIPEDKVAFVQTINPLEHALLVLVKSGYSAIPVLDTKYKLQGIISKTMILNTILGMERIEFEKLSEHKVGEIMKTEISLIRPDESFLKALKHSIDEPFLCVEDEEGHFKGILPRSSMLKYLNHYLRDVSHEMSQLN